MIYMGKDGGDRDRAYLPYKDPPMAESRDRFGGSN